MCHESKKSTHLKETDLLHFFSLPVPQADLHKTDKSDCAVQQIQNLLQGPVQIAQVLCRQKLLERLEPRNVQTWYDDVSTMQPATRLLHLQFT